MMKQMFAMAAVFICGLMIGGTGVGYVMTKDFGESLRLLESGRLAQMQSRTLEAYFNESSEVALWELEHLLDTLERYRQKGLADTRRIAFVMFSTHARLASLYEDASSKKQASHHFERAIDVAQSNPQLIPESVGSVEAQEDVLEMLKVYDESAREAGASGGPSVSANR